MEPSSSPYQIAYLSSALQVSKLFKMNNMMERRERQDSSDVRREEYVRQLEAMAEVLLDIYMDKKHPSPENADGFLTAAPLGRKIRWPPDAQSRHAES